MYKTEPLAARSAEMGIGPILNTDTLTDVPGSMVPWQKAVRESVKNGRLPLWNRFTLAGEPLLAVLQHGMLHPGTWVGFLLLSGRRGRSRCRFESSSAMLGMYLFLRETGCAETASLFGAAACARVCYDPSSFSWKFRTSPSRASLPPLLGLERLAREPGRRSLGLTLAALLLLIAGGHPETLLHAVAGAGIYFVFELAGVQADGPAAVRIRGASRGRPGARAFGVPSASLPGGGKGHRQLRDARPRYAKAERSVPLPQSLARSVKNACPLRIRFMDRRLGDQAFAGPAAYGGSLLLPLACLGLGSRRRERWPFLDHGVSRIVGMGPASAFYGRHLQAPSVQDRHQRVHGLPAAFAVSALAAFGLDRLNGGGGWLGAPCLDRGRSRGGDGPVFSFPGEIRRVAATGPGARLFLAQAVPLLLLALVALVRWRPGPGIPVLALVLLLAQRRVEAASYVDVLPARPPPSPPLALLQGIDSRGPFRIAAVGYMFIPKMATLYELEDVRGDGAMTLASLGEIITLWSVPQPSCLPAWTTRPGRFLVPERPLRDRAARRPAAAGMEGRVGRSRRPASRKPELPSQGLRAREHRPGD